MAVCAAGLFLNGSESLAATTSKKAPERPAATQSQKKAATAQPSPAVKLSPAQIETLQKLQAQHKGSNYRSGPDIAKLSAENMDPVLVGYNIVFSPKWLAYINDGNDGVTREQFTRWRKNAEHIYDTYKDLTGRAPLSGEKIFVSIETTLVSEEDREAPAYYVGNSVVWFKPGNDGKFTKRHMDQIREGRWGDTTMAHEMAHAFASRSKWEAEAETLAVFMQAYAAECAPGLNKAPGKKYRNEQYAMALKAYTDGNIPAFKHYGGGALDLYLFGILEATNWVVIKKALHSYLPKNKAQFTPKNYEEIIIEHANPYNSKKPSKDGYVDRARELLDRIAFFHGDEKVLRSLPDNGKLLDKYFSPKVKD